MTEGLLKEITRCTYETQIKKSPITHGGRISFAEQEPWIQNMTLKDNILFGKEFDQKLYDETVAAC